MSLCFLIAVTIYRFRWAGRACAGDFTDDIDGDWKDIEDTYTILASESYFMYCWVIVGWCFIPLICCWHCYQNKHKLPKYNQLDLTIVD